MSRLVYKFGPYNKPRLPNALRPSLKRYVLNKCGNIMKLKVIVHEAEEGGFWAEVPSIPECATQSESFDEILSNIYETVEGCLFVDVQDVVITEKAKIMEIAVWKLSAVKGFVGTAFSACLQERVEKEILKCVTLASSGRKKDLREAATLITICSIVVIAKCTQQTCCGD